MGDHGQGKRWGRALVLAASRLDLEVPNSSIERIRNTRTLQEEGSEEKSGTQRKAQVFVWVRRQPTRTSADRGWVFPDAVARRGCQSSLGSPVFRFPVLPLLFVQVQLAGSFGQPGALCLFHSTRINARAVESNHTLTHRPEATTSFRLASGRAEEDHHLVGPSHIDNGTNDGQQQPLMFRRALSESSNRWLSAVI